MQDQSDSNANAGNIPTAVSRRCSWTISWSLWPEISRKGFKPKDLTRSLLPAQSEVKIKTIKYNAVAAEAPPTEAVYAKTWKFIVGSNMRGISCDIGFENSQFGLGYRYGSQIYNQGGTLSMKDHDEKFKLPVDPASEVPVLSCKDPSTGKEMKLIWKREEPIGNGVTSPGPAGPNFSLYKSGTKDSVGIGEIVETEMGPSFSSYGFKIEIYEAHWDDKITRRAFLLFIATCLVTKDGRLRKMLYPVVDAAVKAAHSFGRGKGKVLRLV